MSKFIRLTHCPFYLPEFTRRFNNHDVGVKRWLKIIRLVNMHKHLGHALAQSSLAAVLRSCAMVLRLYVHIDETQSLFLAFDLYIIIISV